LPGTSHPLSPETLTKNDGSRFSTDPKGTLTNGLNATFAGKVVIPSDTLYHRAHTPVHELREGDMNWDTLFGKEGVRVFNQPADTSRARPANRPSSRSNPDRLRGTAALF
jgi:hypothetical protein